MKKIHAPDCHFHENPKPVSVLETVGLTWDMVRETFPSKERMRIASHAIGISVGNGRRTMCCVLMTRTQ